MFKGKRYITRGIDMSIPIDMQLFMRELIDNKLRNNEKLDYLQIFNLETIGGEGSALQVIKHNQQQPPFEDTYFKAVHDSATAKIYVINNGTHSTMLLAEEY